MHMRLADWAVDHLDSHADANTSFASHVDEKKARVLEHVELNETTG